MRELREDQTEALEKMRSAVGEGHKRICMQAPTGFGKTVLAGALVNSALAKGKKVLFTVPALSLIDQTVDMFWKQGITEVGVIQASHQMTDWSRPVQVASVQTLMKRPMPEADIVLVDECHRWFTIYETWLSQDQGWQVPVIGLSATPWTKGLGNYYRGPFKAEQQQQCRIVASTTADLIEKKLLSDFKVYAPNHPDLSEVKTVAGDYHEGQLSQVMRDGVLVADAVDTWLRLGERRPTLCYAVDRAHAKTLQQKFLDAGVRCGYQDAYTKDEERAHIRRDFHSGTYEVVCNVGTLTTGIDWDVRCISLCRPTKSDMLFVQIVGRGLRTAEGKDHCLILDHSDNHQRLGFVTDIDQSYTKLHEGKTPAHENRTKGIRLPKECPKCAFLRSPKVSTCPQCGFKPEMVSSIRPDEGELRELKRTPKPVEPIDRETFYAELLAYAMLKNYKLGWASNQYREKFGNWPPQQYKRIEPANSVSDYTRSWIKSRMIAYFKAKEAQQRRFG
jgi:superfamily II DNA or RNA helicase